MPNTTLGEAAPTTPPLPRLRPSLPWAAPTTPLRTSSVQVPHAQCPIP
ncbi:hypothetical protein [Nostoc sp.]